MAGLLGNKSLFAFDWKQRHGWRTLPCSGAVAVCLAAGLHWNHAGAGMVAAGGAMTVGFGSFQWLGRSRLKPMLASTLGMSVCAVAGSLAGHAGAVAFLTAAVLGFGAGWLVCLGPGALWVGQQSAVVALVAGGYPKGVEVAADRAWLILAGGLLQILVTLGAWRLWSPGGEPDDKDTFHGVGPALRTLRANLTPASPAFQFALRQGATVAMASWLAHWLGLSNGYWVPMTALLIIKPEMHETLRRGVERVAGTVLGAALATALVHFLKLDPASTAALVVVFAWLAYTLANVHYGLFAAVLTAYIIFLFDFGGLDPRATVDHRTVDTALGGALALLSYATVFLHRGERKHATTV